MSGTAHLDIDNGLAVITIDHAPVNALSRSVVAKLTKHFAGLADRNAIDAVILTGAGGTFSGGADISEFDSASEDEPDSQAILRLIEDAPAPVIAAIEGTALGGGLEVALACHYRIATPDARLGLPEVTLGLLPGGGGTQRLPRLVGVEPALDMMVSGKLINADKAHAIGLVDHIVDGALSEGAREFVRNLPARLLDGRKLSERLIAADSVAENFFDEYRASIAARTRGYPAPGCIVDCVEAAVGRSFAEGLKVEASRFLTCLQSPESDALRHLFFAERQTGKIPDIPKDTPRRDIRSVAVIGSGTMGGGIAMCFANVGIPVKLLDVDEAALARGLATVRKNYAAGVKKGRITEAKLEQLMGLIQGTLEYSDLAEVDLVIEAVFENMALKKQIFERLDHTCKPGAILATNTSSLDVNEIAASTSRPADVVGLHFFSPANIMRLLEVVRGDATGKDVMATVMRLGRKIGKIPVQSGVCFGFIGNRMVANYGREANLMMLEGATPEQIDRAIVGFGFPMGPATMGDMSGLDIGVKAADEARLAGIGNDDPRASAIARRLVEKGRLGLKAGAGFYRYEPGSRKPVPDPEVLDLIREEAARLGVSQREIGEQEIVERCVYPLINEAAHILEEGIALRPGDVDVTWVNGYAFPRYRGGPLHYADHVGVKHVYDTLCRYRETLDNSYGYWDPAPLLARLAEQGSGFGALSAS